MKGGVSLNILVDADACPVRAIIERVAREYRLPVILFIDSSHVLHSDYSQVVTVGQGADAVDLALVNRLRPGDIVVTQDYGVAALALSRRARAINQNGLVFTDANIDGLLFERYNNRRLRSSRIRTGGFKKRTPQEDHRFESAFRRLCQEALEDKGRE